MDTNNYNYYEEEDEISLLNLIGYVFRHLKKMLIVSIVAALVLGGLLSYKKSRVNEEEYSDNMEAYLASKESLETKIEFTLNGLNNYMKDNSFFELNTDNSYQARALYFVDTDYQVIPNSTYQNIDFTWPIMTAYVSILKSNEVLSNLAQKYDIDIEYINDYISIIPHDYMIDINVYYTNENDALGMLRELENVLLSYKDEISLTFKENNLSKVLEVVYKGPSTDIITIQQNKTNAINNYILSLSEVQDQLSTLIKPEKESVSFLKSFIKYEVVIFLGIFFVMSICYALAFILNGKVYSSNEFKCKTKIKVLGDLTFNKKRNVFIDWINKLENRPNYNNYELIASNINAYGYKKVLLCGDLEEAVKLDMVSNLNRILKNVEIIVSGSSLTDPYAVNELDSVDSVILLIKCNKSTYKSIIEEKEKLIDLKITNVYAIIVE